MDFNAVYHRANDNYCYPLDEEQLVINIRTGYDVKYVNLIHGDPFKSGILGGAESWDGEALNIPFKKRLKNQLWWTTTIRPEFKRLKYYFELQTEDERWFYFEDGFVSEAQMALVGRSRQCFIMPWMNPADIPVMLDYLLAHEYDMVSGWRKDRKDTFMKRFVSRGANMLRYLLVHDGIHDSGCSLKIYRKECFKGINLYGEQHRFIPAILKIKGFTVGEVVVHHRPRTSGRTKYNWKRTFKGFVDMISVWFWNKYATRPLHLLGGLGILFMLLGGGCGIWSVALFCMGYKMSRNIIPPILTVFFMIMGVLMFVFGLMAEILIKIYFGVHVDKSYSIKETWVNEE